MTTRWFAQSVFAMLILCLGMVPAKAQNEAFVLAEQIPPNVHSVQAGGFWNEGSKEGFFRVVVIAGGVEHVSHRLFIQWLKTDARSQTYELVRTVNVRELNLGHGHVLDVGTKFGDINDFKIKVTANSRGNPKKHFSISVKGDGKYTIR